MKLQLQESIGFISDRQIYRYHLCNNWLYTYWKSRAYLTACIAFAWKNHIFIHGVYLPSKKIAKLSEGEALLGWMGSGIWKFECVAWHPEDMALQPDKFLKDIDAERENFGIKSALQLWLDLEKQGWMDAGIDKNARYLFQQELKKY